MAISLISRNVLDAALRLQLAQPWRAWQALRICVPPMRLVRPPAGLTLVGGVRIVEATLGRMARYPVGRNCDTTGLLLVGPSQAQARIPLPPASCCASEARLHTETWLVSLAAASRRGGGAWVAKALLGAGAVGDLCGECTPEALPAAWRSEALLGAWALNIVPGA
eukprot:137417-Chlamydomonas_euryale.AAC.2